MKARPGGDERGQGRGAGIDYMPSMGHIEIPSHGGRGGAANGLVKRGCRMEREGKGREGVGLGGDRLHAKYGTHRNTLPHGKGWRGLVW